MVETRLSLWERRKRSSQVNSCDNSSKSDTNSSKLFPKVETLSSELSIEIFKKKKDPVVSLKHGQYDISPLTPKTNECASPLKDMEDRINMFFKDEKVCNVMFPQYLQDL